ncbi:MAG: cellulose 1,4-beta-cellobiosidase [Oscillospiraceae bacterium]|nr:cellulose 1,4-beta-cellobiosidase [Oscillospiraceae bacterium]
MLLKKSKAVIASILTAAMVTNAMAATMSASAAGNRKKDEAFGDKTYAERFLSLYDDVMTNGITNGYMSKNGAAGDFGIPYHAVEEAIIEAPDYGHETTSEAMSYLVWVAAQRDSLGTKGLVTSNGKTVTNNGDLTDAWKVMENMIPTVQPGYWSCNLSASYANEGGEDLTKFLEEYGSDSSKTATNPLQSIFKSKYGSDTGLYLMHWLGDVDNWYGFGSGTSFTFINTFQRGEQESCWETVPFPCIEELKWGDSQRGFKGQLFNTETTVAKQYAYTNAPDAEDRALQGVYEANKRGVGDASVTKLAGKMGDQLRNNMYDKYYRTIAVSTDDGKWSNWNQYDGGLEGSKHYLMNWYTSWGGSMNSDWAWQIGCSHAHEFYQNPLAAYGLLEDSDLNSAMLSDGATADYKASLQRQMEFYLWLQSSNGPIAGGATNSYQGRYKAYPSGVSTFNGMMYVEHPVYADPGSNHWIGNQVWAVQRLAELYYWVKTNDKGDLGITAGGMSMEKALEQILDKWTAWFVNNTVLTTNGDYYIPSNLNWSGQPDDWNGSATSNSGLTATITGYGNTDLGCVSSLANTLIYYAKAKGVEASDIEGKTFGVGATFKAVDGMDAVTQENAGTAYSSTGDTELPKASLYLAQQLLDREWNIARDDIGLTRVDHNQSMCRMFSQTVVVPESYYNASTHIGMPSGDQIKTGATFLSLRSQYLDASKCAGAKTSDECIAKVKELQAAYEKDVANGASWSGDKSASSTQGAQEIAGFKEVAKVELTYHRFWHAGDIMMALGTMAELYPELTPTDVEDDLKVTLWGDADVDGDCDIIDVITVNKDQLGSFTLTKQGIKNADVDQNGVMAFADAINIMKSLVDLVTLPVSE